MSTTIVPPQAYTKADLTKAYDWLQKQPASIQDLATNAESLMGIYRKALLYGSSSISPKASHDVDEFKSELKQLAGQMQDFDHGQKPLYSSSVEYSSTRQSLPPWAEAQMATKPAPTPVSEHPTMPRQQSLFLDTEKGIASFQPPRRPVHANQAPQESYSYDTAIMTRSPLAHMPPPLARERETSQPSSNPNQAVEHHGVHLDANSRWMLNEVQRKLNLSSEPEALRMMISIAYERIKNLF